MKMQRFFIDDASDKDGDNFIVYEKKTNKIVKSGFKTKFEAQQFIEKSLAKK